MSILNKSPQGLLADLGIPPEPGSLLEQALTHRSFANQEGDPATNNERLEFLGDAVLGIVVAELLYRQEPELTEGKMSQIRAALVGTVPLAALARALDLGSYLRVGEVEEVNGGRDKESLLADCFEALIGALYFERGLDAATRLIETMFTDRISTALEGRGENFKGLLQEEVMRLMGTRPRYEVDPYGLEHDRRFAARVYVGEELWGAGNGRSKRKAEQRAAGEALARLDKNTTVLGEGSDARAS